MLTLSYFSEIFNQLTVLSVVGQIWAIPFLVWLVVVDVSTASKWTVWAVITLLLSYPNGRSLPLHRVQQTLTYQQHILFKLVGIRETPTRFALAQSLLLVTTCSSKPAVSSLLMSTEKVRFSRP